MSSTKMQEIYSVNIKMSESKTKKKDINPVYENIKKMNLLQMFQKKRFWKHKFLCHGSFL